MTCPVNFTKGIKFANDMMPGKNGRAEILDFRRQTLD